MNEELNLVLHFFVQLSIHFRNLGMLIEIMITIHKKMAPIDF